MSDHPLVHVIDDDEAVRNSVRFLLQTASMDAHVYESPVEFLNVWTASSSSCIVTDIRMPGMNGLDLLMHLQANGPSPPVIVMTGDGDIPLAAEALRAGAFDFIEKPFDDEVLISAVRAALDPDQEQKKSSSKEEAAKRMSALTSQECAVLERIFAGQKNDEIARALRADLHTVELCRASILAKLGARSLSEVVRIALIAGNDLGTRSD